MPLSARRLLVLIVAAALGGGAAQAVAATGTAHTAKVKKKAKRAAKARAVKIGTGTGWVPPGALAGRAPLTGAAGGGPGTGGGTTTGPATTTPGTTTTTPTSTDPPSLQSIGVTVDERTGYKAILSRTSVAAGAVVVQLINQGDDAHNLRVVPTDHAGAAVDFPETASDANTTKTLQLTPGTYRLFCTLTTPVNHELAGMNATLTVSP
jgi:plastocyanin